MRIKSQVVFSRVSGLAEDVVVNTFYASMTGVADAADLTAWHERLALFYNGPGDPSGDGLHAYLSPVLSRAAGGVIIKSYDLDAAPPVVPVLQDSFGLGPAQTGAQPLPSEVAVCLSYRAEQVSGENPRRRRGRVYIGPLVVQDQTSGTLDPRPNDALKDILLDAAAQLATPTDPPGSGLDWRGYSEADNLQWFIDTCWVDDAFDTQRRRGPRPTSRMQRVVS
jgi:hypothetical protein